MPRIQVRFFGAFRDLAGKDTTEVEARTVGELLQTLKETFPPFRDRAILVAVNHEMVQDEARELRPEDEVAVFPPVGGG